MNNKGRICARCENKAKCMANHVPLCWQHYIKESVLHKLDCERALLDDLANGVKLGRRIDAKTAEYLTELMSQAPNLQNEYPELLLAITETATS